MPEELTSTPDMGIVAILGEPGDREVVRLSHALERCGGVPLLIDTGSFPGAARWSCIEGRWRIEGRELPACRSAYLRSLGKHPAHPMFAADLAERPKGLLAQCDETRAMTASLVLHLGRAGARIVNPLEVNAQHSRKPHQLARLASAGLPLPRWLATNDPQAVRTFVNQVGCAVYKPLAGGATVRPVEQDDLSEERLGALALAPVLFQERVDGVAVRAYTVDSTVASAAELRSDELDYRCNEGEVCPTRLTHEEEAAVSAAARACGMAFSGVDLIRRRDGGFVVLECNPSPMFAVFEDKTGLDVAMPLAKMLLG